MKWLEIRGRLGIQRPLRVGGGWLRDSRAGTCLISLEKRSR